jgi:hypothetical protein
LLKLKAKVMTGLIKSQTKLLGVLKPVAAKPDDVSNSYKLTNKIMRAKGLDPATTPLFVASDRQRQDADKCALPEGAELTEGTGLLRSFEWSHAKALPCDRKPLLSFSPSAFPLTS